MNKVLILTKIMLKNAGSSWKAKKGGGWKSLLILIAIGLGFLPLIMASVLFISGLYDGLEMVGQQGALLGLGVAVVSLAIFILGIVYVLSVFYYSQDVEHMLPLPLAPWQILGAKFLVALLYEYLTELILLGPILVTFGVKSGAGILYYLYALVVFLLVPVLPLMLSALVVMLFMRSTNVGKSKDRFRLIGGLLAIGVAIGFQVVVQRQTSGKMDNIEQMQQMILTGENTLLNLVTQLFPASKLAALALINSTTWSGLGYLAVFFLIAAASVAVFLFIGNRLYFRGVMGISEAMAKRKKVDETAFHKLVRSRSALMAYAAKEWKILWRTPAYLMNCTLSSILLPVLGLIPFLSRQDSKEMLASLSASMQGEHTGGVSVAVAFVAFMVMAGINSTSVTAITREGQGFFLNKSLPIPAIQILMAKLMPGIILSALSMLLLLAEGAWFLDLSPVFVLSCLLAGIPGIIFINMFGIMVDLHLPKLSWSSEQEAVKRNMNPLFTLILSFIAGALMVWCAYGLGGSMTVTALGLFALFTILDVILYRILVTKGPVWMDKIEA
ncbi:putative ABC transporter permease subunit [Brevibacillus sp. NRS-1366]|uniref:putative ABC transporter permease subunit n=1 Tax=Brevibacillus sp. NRS-1366 TaxID=3233899 RepID=UPI003D206605